MSEAPPPYGAPPPPPPAPGGFNLGGGDERTWATAAHWSSLVAAFVALAFLGPLVVLFTKGGSSAYVRRHAVESLNFQLSMLIYGVVGTLIGIVLVVATLGVGILVILPLALAFSAFWLIITIVAAVKTSSGEDYRYPLTIRMVS
jgi:uncharacterized Tic20 family protein